jgi:hypothetical protein
MRVLLQPELGSRARTRMREQHVYYTLMLTYLVLPTVSQVQFKGLSCATLASGERYLRVDTSVECNFQTSADFRLILACDIPLIILYQSIPIVWAWLLYTHRQRLNPPVNDPRRAYELRAKDDSIAHLSFLVNDYSCALYYYEVIEMVSYLGS